MFYSNTLSIIIDFIFVYRKKMYLLFRHYMKTEKFGIIIIVREARLLTESYWFRSVDSYFSCFLFAIHNIIDKEEEIYKWELFQMWFLRKLQKQKYQRKLPFLKIIVLVTDNDRVNSYLIRILSHIKELFNII